MADGMKKCKGNGNTTLLFSLKGLEILHHERIGQVKIIVMEHFNGILFNKLGPANKQNTNHSITVTGKFEEISEEINCKSKLDHS